MMQLNPFNSWSWKFARTWLPHMTASSFLRLRSNYLNDDIDADVRANGFRLRMKHPISGDLWIRPHGSDVRTFDEIIRYDVYGPIVKASRHAKYVMDLGANIGLATRYFADALPGSSIFAVEPDARNFAMLQRNTATLALKGRCRTLRAAAWNCSGEVNLREAEGVNAFDSMSVGEGPEGAPVQAYSVDELIARSGFPQVDLLKVDVEGAEVQLFESADRWIERVQMIAVEFHGNTRAESGFDDVVLRSGFEVDDSHRHTVMARRRGNRHRPRWTSEVLARV